VVPRHVLKKMPSFERSSAQFRFENVTWTNSERDYGWALQNSENYSFRTSSNLKRNFSCASMCRPIVYDDVMRRSRTRGGISRSMLVFVMLGTHGTCVSGFATPLVAHLGSVAWLHTSLSPILTRPGARAGTLGGGAMPHLPARRRRTLRPTPCKWLHVSAIPPAAHCGRCCHIPVHNMPRCVAAPDPACECRGALQRQTRN
jgi:hypothetical protein